MRDVYKTLPGFDPMSKKALLKRFNELKSNLESEYNVLFLDLARQYSTLHRVEEVLNDFLHNDLSIEFRMIDKHYRILHSAMVISPFSKTFVRGLQFGIPVASLAYLAFDINIASVLTSTLAFSFSVASSYFPVLTPDEKRRCEVTLDWYSKILNSMYVSVDNTILPEMFSGLSVPTVSGPTIRIEVSQPNLLEMKTHI